MIEDEEGVGYPQISVEKCIRYYLCIRICPIKWKNEESPATMC